MKRWILIFCAVALTMVSCGRNQSGDGKEGEPTSRVPVKAVPVQLGTLQKTLTIYGRLLPRQVTTLSSQFPGRIATLSLAEGDRVAAGQVVAVIRSPKAEALQQAADGTTSFLQKEMHPISLRAPIGGVVTRKFRFAGDVVAAGEPILEILDDSSFFLRGDLPAAYLPEVRVGQTITVTFPDLPEETFTTTIGAINGTVDPATQTAEMRALLPNPHRRLKADLFARIRIIVKSTPEALLVPRDAVLQDPAGAYVFVVQRGIAQRRAVKTGLQNRSQTVVLSGLAEGDSVVVLGNFELQNGMAVEVQHP